MKTKNRIPFLSIGLTSLVFLGLAGSISGSLAWWAYSTRVSITYQGTSVASSEQLQVGIKTEVNLSGLGMTHETIGGESYYWCDAGMGLPAEIVKTYLESYTLQGGGHYASSELQPITSGSYTTGDLSLKNPLISGTRFNSRAADSDKYVRIPFAFRVMRYNSSNTLEPAKGENIWLTDTSVEASDAENDGNVYKAIRMFTVGKEARKNGNNIEMLDVKRLINPSNKTNVAGQTAVAGLLDISGSGYYDTYEKGATSYNIIYGETNYATEDELIAIETTQQSSSESSGIIDFNGTGNATMLTTFTSKFYKGTYRPAQFSDISPKYQNFDTLGTVKPNDDNGALTGGQPLCATDLVNGVADLDVTIWLEGWDHNVIDQENHHSFNLGLQFQISRL